MDQQSFLQRSACSSGKVDEAVVRETCRELILNWLYQGDMSTYMGGTFESIIQLCIDRGIECDAQVLRSHVRGSFI